MSTSHTSHDAPAAPGADHGKAHKREHAIPLWGLFLALLALTALEVGFFELWSDSDLKGHPFVDKYVMVLVILVALTLPKALIVLIWFMHLKFEKQLVTLCAVLPFGFAALAVIPPLTDIKTLKGDGKTYNQVDGLTKFAAEINPHGNHSPAEHAPGKAVEHNLLKGTPAGTPPLAPAKPADAPAPDAH